MNQFYYTYILHLSNNQLYAGYTDDFQRRFKEHVQGKVKSTRNYLPVTLIFYEAFLNIKDAKRRERYFKTDKGKKILRVMLRAYFENLT
jgi:putative endonuclease